MKRILTTLMTIMLMMGMAGSAERVYQEIPLPVSAQPTFCLLYTSPSPRD